MFLLVYEWISVYDLIDDNVANDMREQWFIAFLK